MDRILIILTIFCLPFVTPLAAQSLLSRTGHVRVQSTTKHVDVVVNNYQVEGMLDLTNKKFEFSALIHSFDFNLGMAY